MLPPPGALEHEPRQDGDSADAQSPCTGCDAQIQLLPPSEVHSAPEPQKPSHSGPAASSQNEMSGGRQSQMSTELRPAGAMLIEVQIAPGSIPSQLAPHAGAALASHAFKQLHSSGSSGSGRHKRPCSQVTT